MNIEEQINQLRQELRDHNYNYYVLDNPTISDFDFDIKHISQFIDSQKRDKSYVNNDLIKEVYWDRLIFWHKKRQATYITLLQPSTLAAFPPWEIPRELVV